MYRMFIFDYIRKLKDKLFEDKKLRYIIILGFIFLFLFVLIILPPSFSALHPVKSIEIYSENFSYQEKDSGAWKVTQSARFVSKDKVKMVVDVDSIFSENSKNMDVVFVLDKSISMQTENKLNKAIKSIEKVSDEVLLSEKNKIALISFDDNFKIVTDFTNNKDLLTSKLESITPGGLSSYYQALIGADNLLQNYRQDNNRECIVVFLTGSLPTKDVPNEKAFYKYLKNKYPFIIVNTIQYDFSNTILKPIEEISDNVYISSNNLNETISKAVDLSENYNSLSFKDNIDSNYFKIESASSSEGNINIDIEDNSLNWNLDRYRSGSKASLEIILQRSNFDADYYVVNNSVEINSKLIDKEERVITSSSPILKDKYQVSYDGNFPSDCSSDEVPSTEIENIFDIVDVSDVKLKCDGYQFKGWRLKSDSVTNINDDYFIMPEDDVVFVAEWSKTSLNKSVEGTIYKRIPPVLQAVNDTYNEEIWAYKDTITKIIIQDEISNISGTIHSYDISEKKDGKVLGKIVSNGNGTYTAYIQGDGKIMANTDSSYLFYKFSNLVSIEGLANLDTSSVSNMLGMFAYCLKITSLDCSTFNTSNVENMGFIFSNCRELTYVNTSKFNTSKVTNMACMFYNCIKLIHLDLSNFNTGNVTDMSSMFSANGNESLSMSLTGVNVSSFNTSKVTTMRTMFASCGSLISLNLSNFDTSRVENMDYMFLNNYNLVYLNISSFDTRKVKNMVAMFCGCQKLPSLNLSEFVIGDVPDISYIFHKCYKLTANVTIKGNNITNYYAAFIDSVGANITVNYTSVNSALVDRIIATKSSGSNIRKGIMVAV